MKKLVVASGMAVLVAGACISSEQEAPAFDDLGTVDEANSYLEVCDDGIDNDGNGYVDCDDWDCVDRWGTVLDAACDPNADNPEPPEEPSRPSHLEVCDDGVDNDGNGYIDCDDWDCVDSRGVVLDPACDPQVDEPETPDNTDPPVVGTIEPGKTGDDLIVALKSAYRPRSLLSYNRARSAIFGDVDNHNGEVECIYTGYTISLAQGSSFSRAYSRGLNVEHSYPSSKGGPRADMHHLFPSRTNVNSARGNFPFVEIPDSRTDHWYRDDRDLRSMPTSDIDEYSEKDGSEFEPRESVKGDLARAMFYVHIMHRGANSSFFNQQLPTLLQWHAQDPITAEEQERSDRVEALQGNANPFVWDETLPTRIYR